MTVYMRSGRVVKRGGGMLSSNTLQTDWLARQAVAVAANGWGQTFETDADVDNWRFTNGVGWDPTPAGVGANVRRNATEGIMGRGALEIEQLTTGNMNSYWTRCFNPAIAHYTSNAGGDRTAGQEFWLQFRGKANDQGQGSTGGEGRKFFSASRSEASYTFQEIVWQDLFNRGVYQMYQGMGVGSVQYAPFEEGGYPGSDINLQPGSDFAEPGGRGYCSYQLVGASDRTDCWVQDETYITYNWRIKPATDQTADGIFTGWAARAGATSWTKIMDKQSLWMHYDPGFTAGFNAVLAWIYETNRTAGPANQKQWYDQIIYQPGTVAPALPVG